MLRRVVVGAVLLVVVLAGCSGEAETEPEASPSGTVADSATPTTPVASDPTEVVAAWMAAYSEATADGDLSEVEALSSDACETCENLMEPVRDVYSSGGSMRWPGWEITNSQVLRRNEESATVHVRAVSPKGVTVPRQGAEPTNFPRIVERFEFRLKNSDSEMLIHFIGLLS